MPLRSYRAALVRAGALLLLATAVAWPGAAPRAEPGGGPEFVDLKAVVIPVISRRQLTGHFIFEIVLELQEGVMREDIMVYEPRMRDAMITDMKRYTERHPGILERADLPKMKRVLSAAVERTAGEGLVRDVLFEHIYQRTNPYQAVTSP